MTTYPRLTQDADLVGLPGAPFPTAIVLAAEAMVRGAVDWHIAPQFEETMQVEASQMQRLMLKTLRIVTISSITDSVGNVIDPTGYTIHKYGTLVANTYATRWTPGMIYTVDLTHGYDSAPDLLPVIAAICQKSMTDATLTQRSETVGQRTSSESYNVNRIDVSVIGTTENVSPLDRYRLQSFGR